MASLQTWKEKSVKKPPKHFEKKLQAYDPNLFLMWNTDYECWDIFEYKGENQRPQAVMRVCEPDNSYRPLDDRVFFTLRYIDIKNKPEQLKKLFEEYKQYQENRKRSAVKEMNNIQQELTKDINTFLIRGRTTI